jgi:hypothetical protein
MEEAEEGGKSKGKREIGVTGKSMGNQGDAVKSRENGDEGKRGSRRTRGKGGYRGAHRKAGEAVHCMQGQQGEAEEGGGNRGKPENRGSKR